MENMNNTIYTDKELQILNEACIEHAVFSFVEDFYGLAEADFIQWLSDSGVPFRCHHNLYPYIDEYCKLQESFNEVEVN